MTEAAPSPFLPGTKIQYAWDSTSLGWLKTCPRLYQYSMIEGWRARGSHVHLVFGQHYHAALEAYDKFRLGYYLDPPDGGSPEPMNHEDALRRCVFEALDWTWERPNPLADNQIGKPWDSEHPSKTRETLIRSIIWYLDQFRDDPAKTVVLANGKPAVELSFRMEMEWGPTVTEWKEDEHGRYPGEKHPVKVNRPYILCGHLDRVVEFNSQRYVMDRKTTGSALTPYYFDNFSPDNQMSIYTIAAKVQFQTPVAGVIIDAAQIMIGFTRFQRGFTYRTDTVLEEWLADFRYWTDLAEGFAERDHWPMNDKACGLYGGCLFRGICSKSPEVREKFLESDFERRPWNPLESR